MKTMNKLTYPRNKKNIWFNNLVKPVVDKINEIINKVNDSGDSSEGGIVNITNTDDNLIITNDGNNININLNTSFTLNKIIRYDKSDISDGLEIGYLKSKILITHGEISNATDMFIGFPDTSDGYINITRNETTNLSAILFKTSNVITFSFDGYSLQLNATDCKKLRQILNNYTLQNP